MPQALPLVQDARPHGRRMPHALRAARIVHPFPSALNVAATAGLALVAAGGMPAAGLLTRMLVVMACAQCAIGVVNDICDQRLDARTKPWKPIPAALVSPRAAVALAAAFIAATLALGITLGGASLLLVMAGLACGLAYDVRLKRTWLSALPFMVAIPVLPIWVWTTVDAWHADLWWLLPLGAPIGLALHLANTVPDIEGDARHGVRGLAHRLGARGSLYLGWASFAAALAVSAALAPVVDYDLRAYVPAALAGGGLLGVSVVSYALRRDGASLQLGFGLLGVGSAVVAVGWLAAVS